MYSKTAEIQSPQMDDHGIGAGSTGSPGFVEPIPSAAARRDPVAPLTGLGTDCWQAGPVGVGPVVEALQPLA